MSLIGLFVVETNLFLEAQKLLLDIDRPLINDARLWAIYDNHEVRKAPEFVAVANSPMFQAKLRPFGHIWAGNFVRCERS